MVTSVPGAAFGLAFNEASGPCLVRADGTDDSLRAAAIDAALAIGAGHTFVLFMRNAYPINVLNRIKDCPEVCRIFLRHGQSAAGGGRRLRSGPRIVGVIDGASPKASSRKPTASGASGSSGRLATSDRARR